MQRPGTEAITTQIQLSKPKREITKITNSQNSKRTYRQPGEQLFTKRLPLSNSNRTKNNMSTRKMKHHRNSDKKQATENHNRTECASEIARVLSHIFQISINTGELHKDWRNANVSPIFKKGDRHYIPVSLTCVCYKLLENIHCSLSPNLKPSRTAQYTYISTAWFPQWTFV